MRGEGLCEQRPCVRTGPVEERGAMEKAALALWMGGFLLRDASPEGRLSEEKGTMAGRRPIMCTEQC